MQNTKNSPNLIASPVLSYYRLTIEGLHLIYHHDGARISVRIDPRPLCEWMKRLGMIEGVDEDTNREPVILYSREYKDEYGYPSYVTGYCEWSDFVRTYPMKKYEAEMLAAYNESEKTLNRFFDTIKNLTAWTY